MQNRVCTPLMWNPIYISSQTMEGRKVQRWKNGRKYGRKWQTDSVEKIWITNISEGAIKTIIMKII
jgi:hypothetical protein